MAGVVPSSAGFKSQIRIGWCAGEVMMVNPKRPSGVATNVWPPDCMDDWAMIDASSLGFLGSVTS